MLFIALLAFTVLLALCGTSSARPVASTLATAPLAPLPRIHIFLIAGQSNSVGFNSDPFTAEDAVVDRIWQLQVCSNNGTSLPPAQTFLNVSAEPLEPCAGAHVSFARPFARALLSALPADDLVVLVPTGISGTGFFDKVWPAYTGSGFIRAVERLKVTWQLLHDEKRWQQYNITWSGVLWHQGEHDAGDNAQGNIANTSYYLNHDIIPMIHALRNTSYIHFTHHTLPFIAAQMLPSWINNASHPVRHGVEVALAMVTQYVPYTGFADSYGLLGDPMYRSGLDNEIIHFTARSQRILGKRYFAAYQAALLNYPEQPPASEIASVEAGTAKKHMRWTDKRRQQQ